jgi:GNAT superfamily N-acetyltransferase
MSSAGPLLIVQATTPAQIDSARSLFLAYGAFIAAALGPDHACHTNLDREAAALPGQFAPPRGRLLLANLGERPIGCIGLRPLTGERAEIKRLWVESQSRSHHAGSALLDAAIIEAQQLGYREIVLDTVPSVMPEAVRLYASRGFFPTQRFNDSPLPGVVFLSRTL